MYLSTSAFGVVASSSPQAVIIQPGRAFTADVNDIDGYFSSNHFLKKHSHNSLDFLSLKQNAHPTVNPDGLLQQNVLQGFDSDPENGSSRTKNSGISADLSKIRITNVRSLAPNQIIEERGKSFHGSMREKSTGRLETNPEQIDRYDIEQNERMLSVPGDQSNLNSGQSKNQNYPNTTIIRASPTSIYRRRKTRPRNFYFGHPRHSHEISKKRMESSYNLALNKINLMPVNQSPNVQRQTMINSGEAREKHDEIQTNYAKNGLQQPQGNPVFMLTLPHQGMDSPITRSSNISNLERDHQRLQIFPAPEPGLHAQGCAPNSSSPQDQDRHTVTFPITPVNADFSLKTQCQQRRKSTRIQCIRQSSAAKVETISPLADEILADLEVVRIHRRPNFQTQESRELVEVRPRGLPEDAPTLLAYRELSGRILVDWSAKSNYPAAEKIKNMLGLHRLGKGSHLGRESGYAHNNASTTTAQCPHDVTTLVANGVVYTVSDQ